jgi:RimJ/RimL family protein N-acetyltransferase
MIRTERLLLRRARLDDAADLFRVFGDPRAMRYWDTPPHAEVGQTRAWLERVVTTPAAEGDDFVVELDGRAIGKAGVWRIAEVGFILHPDHWGRGFAFEALAAALPHAFATLALDRVEADVDPRNARSLGLLARLGFRESGRAERTIRVGDEWCDSVYLELDRAAAGRLGPAGR